MLLIDTINAMSLNSLVVLDSKSHSYGRLLAMINNKLTNAEIQEIKKQTKETLAYTEFDGYDQFLSIIKPCFSQEFFRAQVITIFSPSGKKITQDKPRLGSRTPNARRKEILISKPEKNIIQQPDNSRKIIQPQELSTDVWACTRCTYLNSAPTESCKMCGYYRVKFVSDKNHSSTPQKSHDFINDDSIDLDDGHNCLNSLAGSQQVVSSSMIKRNNEKTNFGCKSNTFINTKLKIRDLLAPKSSRNWECSCGESNPIIAARCNKCKGKKTTPTIYEKKCSICTDPIGRASCPHCKEIVLMGEFCLKCKNSLNDVDMCRTCIKRRYKIIG